MMDIIKILNNDTSELSEEEKIEAEKFTEKLKEVLIDELVNYEVKELIVKLSRDKEEFREKIENILVDGVKGFKNMNMQLLITMYLEKMGNEAFVKIIQNI